MSGKGSSNHTLRNNYIIPYNLSLGKGGRRAKSIISQHSQEFTTIEPVVKKTNIKGLSSTNGNNIISMREDIFPSPRISRARRDLLEGSSFST